MSAAEKVTPINTPKLNMGQAYLSGLITNRRRVTGTSGTTWLTILKLPAADKFSHPSTVEVRSTSPVGEINQEWAGVVNVGGFPRSFNGKPDPDTGEIKAIKTAQIHLDVVED
jgi:hypothetical protein